jgi:hypothetical protein
MTRTPEFVRWTLVHACALREETNVADPEQTARQLHALRMLDEGLAAGRVFEGICLENEPTAARAADVYGLVVDEVFAAYGGEASVRAQCGSCPANLWPPESRLAGCFGMLVLDEPLAPLLEQTLHAARASAREAFDQAFPPTTPLRYGVWADPIGAAQLDWLAKLLAGLASAAAHLPDERRREIDQLALAIERAQTTGLTLAARLFPPGTADALAWTVDAHCSRCRASLAERAARCHVCGLNSRPVPPRRRKPRGRRPFVPLARFLGDAGAAQFLARYAGGNPPGGAR